MATTLTLPYVRFVRQVSSGPGALPQFAAMMRNNLEKLKVASWVQATADAASVAMPANAPLTFTPSDAYDAYKMSSTTAQSGIETAYAGMAAYRFTIPADAISGSKYIRGLTVTLGADKFAYSGIKVAIHASNIATPSTDWDFIRTGGYGSTLDVSKEFATYDADPEVYGVLTGHVANVSTATNQAGEYTFDLSGLGNTNYSYLWVYITMFDYTDYRASRQYWVEGSGIVNGATAEVTFASDVTADADGSWNGEYAAYGRHYYVSGGVFNGWRDAAYQVKDLSYHSSGSDAFEKSARNMLATFPDSGYTNENQSTFAYADTATSGVGIGTGTVGVTAEFPGELKGYIMARYVSLPPSASITRMRFSGNLIDLSSKSVSVVMNVWLSNSFQDTMTVGTQTTTNDGYKAQHQFYSNIGGSTQDVKNAFMHKWYYGNEGANMDVDRNGSKMTLALTHVKRFVLMSRAYTSSDWFEISLAGTGRKQMIMVTFAPENYWAAAGANTYATLTPGAYIYLK